MGRIHELPKSSSRLLTSSQIITSVFCVVKELIENSLDGSAKNVEVKLEDYGLEKIEVKDNGCGIDKSDISFVARPHFTSKIASYSDLEKVNTYGFRGEALGAVCAVADLVITTKTSEEKVGCTVNYSHDGQIISTKPSPCSQGSTVSVLHLFKNIPVRRKYYRSEANKKEDLRKVEELLIAYGCIAYDIRFALYHNKNLIWQKPALSCRKDALIHILGNSVVDHLKHSEYTDEQNQRKFEIYLPSSDAPLSCGLSSSSKCITAINNRPVRIKSFDKVIKEYYNKAIQNTGKTRFPICFISFTVPSREVDINIEPNKTNVMLHYSDEILKQFSEMLEAFYNINVVETNQAPLSAENVDSNLKPQQNASDFLDSIKSKCDVKFEQTKLLYLSESPVTAKKNSFGNDGNIVKNTPSMFGNIVKNTPSQKKENPIVKKDITKEPCKKKLKTSFHASHDDIQNHLTSLKNFFSRDKTNNGNMPLSAVPTVTVERITSAQESTNSDFENLGNSTDSIKATSFVINTNISTENNSPVTVNTALNRKRHFSDSSASNGGIPEVSIKQPVIDNGEAWSRGVHPSGGLFQPVKVLQPKTAIVPESFKESTTIVIQSESVKDLQLKTIVVPESPFKELPAVVIQPKPVKDLQPKITSVSELFFKESSAMVNESRKEIHEQKSLSSERKLTAFDLFCRNNRLEVAAQNPDFNYQQIAQLLTEKWNHLSSEEKAMYKNMLDKDYKQSVKKKERLGKIVSESLSLTQNKACKEMKSKVKDKVISFHTEDIKGYYKNKNRELLLGDELDIINCLAPGIWVCSKKGKLQLLNTFRLQETIIYHRLLETFQFEPENLENSLSITAQNISDEGMEVLMKLSKTDIKGSTNIDDQRLTANGFDVKVTKGMQNDVEVELVGIANNIAFYGIPDLKELLLLIKSKDYPSSLSECRPGKITLYLQGEANRMSRHSPPCQRIQDVEDLLSQNRILNTYKECIHHKPFFNELWSFP